MGCAKRVVDSRGIHVQRPGNSCIGFPPFLHKPFSDHRSVERAEVSTCSTTSYGQPAPFQPTISREAHRCAPMDGRVPGTPREDSEDNQRRRGEEPANIQGRSGDKSTKNRKRIGEAPATNRRRGQQSDGRRWQIGGESVAASSDTVVDRCVHVCSKNGPEFAFVGTGGCRNCQKEEISKNPLSRGN